MLLDLLVGLLVLTALSLGIVLVVRARLQAGWARSREVFALEFPRGLPAAAAVAALRALAGLLPPRRKRWLALPAVVFEVRADGPELRHLLRVPASLTEFVTRALRSSVPGLRFTPVTDEPAVRWRLAGELGLVPSVRPLRLDQSESAAAAILSALPVREGEQAVLQWVIAPAVGRLPMPEEAAARGRLAWLDVLTGRRQLGSRERKAVEAKLAEPLFLACGRVAVAAGTPERCRQVLRRLTGVFHVMNTPTAHLQRRLVPSWLAARRIADGRVPLVRFTAFLNARELPPLLGFPVGSPQIAGLKLGGCRQLAPSPEIPWQGLVMAHSVFPGVERPLALSTDAAMRGVLLLAPTGAGKTTTMLSLFAQVVRAGAGALFLDPAGDAALDALDLIPVGREVDIIYLDVRDDHPVGFNVLTGAPPEVVADLVTAVLRHRFVTSWGPRLEELLRTAVHAVACVPGLSVVEVVLFLTDPAFRRWVVGQVDEPIAVEPVVAWYEALSEAERQQVASPVLNKVRPTFGRTELRRILGQSASAFDFDSVLREGKMVIVALPRGVIGDDAAAILGGLILARFWLAVRARAQVAPDARPPFYAFVDEVQEFVGGLTNLGDVFAQSRKFFVSWCIAAQSLAQLPSAMRQAVLVNARSKLIWQTGADDAQVLAKELSPHLTADDLRGLGQHEVVALLSVGSHVAPPATAVALPPPAATGGAAAVREASRARYGRLAAEVERDLRARHRRRPAPSTVGKRRRSS